VSVTVGCAGLTCSAVPSVSHETLLALLAVRAVGVVGALGTGGQFVLARALAVAVALAGSGAVQSDETKLAVAGFRLDASAVFAALRTDGVTARRCVGSGSQGNWYIAGFACAVESLQKKRHSSSIINSFD
jgi:hypothetical protein